MAGKHAELRLGAAGRRLLLVPSTAVIRPRDESGPIELRLGVFETRTRLVPWHAVHRPSREGATSLLRKALADAGNSSYGLARQLGLDLRDPEQVIARVVDMLVGGSYVLVELAADDIPLRGAAFLDRKGDPGPEPAPLLAPRTGTRLHVRVVLDDAAALASADVTLTGPDGRSAEVSTGGGGDARLEDLPADGTGRAVVRPGKVPRALAEPATLLHADHLFDFPFTSPVTADVSTGPMQTILLRRPEVDRVDTSNLAFARESALLVALAEPVSPTQALATALARLQRAPPCRLLIVGHASPDGDPKANEALAERRAAGVRHLLAGDRDAWVGLAAQHGSPADVQRLLRYLAMAHDWPTEPTRIDGGMDDAVEAAVANFQAHYNAIFDAELAVDGVCGEQTLGALFDVQQHELRIQLDTAGISDGPPKWFTSTGLLSAGARILAHPAIPGSDTADGQRRVDLLLIPDDIEWREFHGIERLYDVARLRLLPLSPLSVGPCDLVVQLVDHYGRALANEPYRLTTAEETREGTSDDQGVVIERGVRGKLPRLECGEAVVIVDDRYHRMTTSRHERMPVFPRGAEEPEDDAVLDGPAAYDDEPDDIDDGDDLDEDDIADADDEQDGG